MVAFSILAIALHYISFCCLFIGVKLLVSVSSVWCVFTEWICRSFALWLWWIFMDLFVHVLHCSWATNGHPRLQLFQPTEVCCTKGWALPRDRWTWRSCWHVALGGRKVGTLKLTSWHHRKMEPGILQTLGVSFLALHIWGPYQKLMSRRVVGNGSSPRKPEGLRWDTTFDGWPSQVLEEPEPEAKLAKPPPVATAPVQTFTPKAGLDNMFQWRQAYISFLFSEDWYVE